jgi:hypothetical protein
MRITFENILNEDRKPRQQKFIDVIVAEMKKYYEGRYQGTHWVDATHGLSLEQIQKYRGYVDNVKRLGEEMKKYDGMFQNIDRHSPRGLRENIEKYWKLSNEYREALYGVAHLADMFSRNDWTTPNFLENYAVPVGVLLDAWEQFFHDVYTPGKIEHGKKKWGVDLEHGLPEGDYSEPIFRDGRTVVFEDKGNGGFILGLDVDWKWNEEGIQFSNLYYKRHTSKEDIKKDLIYLAKEELRNDLKGASVTLEPNEVDEVVGELDKSPMFRYEEEAEEYQTTLQQIISDYIDSFSNYDRDFNISHNESESVAHYYIEYKESIDKLNF